MSSFIQPPRILIPVVFASQVDLYSLACTMCSVTEQACKSYVRSKNQRRVATAQVYELHFHSICYTVHVCPSVVIHGNDESSNKDHNSKIASVYPRPLPRRLVYQLEESKCEKLDNDVIFWLSSTYIGAFRSL